MIGKTLAHYDVTELLGAGGMGEVYRAHDTKLGRDVALKILPESFAADAERLSRFEREAKLLAGLNHANIAAIYGIEQADSQRFLVLELVEGIDLAKRLGEGPLIVEDALAVGYQISEALEAAISREWERLGLKRGRTEKHRFYSGVELTPEASKRIY